MGPPRGGDRGNHVFSTAWSFLFFPLYLSCQLDRFWRLGFLGFFLCPVTGYIELKDDRMVDQPVDGGRSGHRILEDAIPLAEHQVLCGEYRYAESPH